MHASMCAAKVCKSFAFRYLSIEVCMYVYVFLLCIIVFRILSLLSLMHACMRVAKVLVHVCVNVTARCLPTVCVSVASPCMPIVPQLRRERSPLKNVLMLINIIIHIIISNFLKY